MVLPAAEPRAVTVDAALPFGQAPVDYLGDATSDPVARLNRRLVDGEVTLKPVTGRGYLDAVLRVLQVPVSSQLLVYSKTAVNQRLVTPKTPRAIYFNDTVSVAWVPRTAELELSAVDPVKGAMVVGHRGSTAGRVAWPATLVAPRCRFPAASSGHSWSNQRASRLRVTRG